MRAGVAHIALMSALVCIIMLCTMWYTLPSPTRSDTLNTDILLDHI